MKGEVRLTKGQMWLLEHLQYGERIIYSQDGDYAWMSPSDIWIGPSDISDDDLANLRARTLIAGEPLDEDGDYRFSPAEIITPAGRSALAAMKE